MKIGGITSKNELIYHEGHALYSIDLATCERRQPIKALSAPVDWQYQPGDPYLLDFVYDAENHVIIAECVDWFDIYAEDFDINAIEAMDRFLTWNNPVLRKGEGVLECS